MRKWQVFLKPVTNRETQTKLTQQHAGNSNAAHVSSNQFYLSDAEVYFCDVSTSKCICDIFEQSNDLNVSNFIDNSKVFTTGQARVNPKHYVIKCMGGRSALHYSYGILFLVYQTYKSL